MELTQLTDEELRDAEREIAAQKQEREYVKWDAELVGRCFRIIRTPCRSTFPPAIAAFERDNYVTLEETLGVGGVDEYGHPANYVYADVVYLHIKQRAEHKLTCSGFEVSHAHRDEPYLKIQPVFYSYSDFRNYLGQWNSNTGPTKHFDEISETEYREALRKAVENFSAIERVEEKRTQ